MSNTLPKGFTYENKSKTHKIEFLEPITNGQGGFAITYKGILSNRTSPKLPYGNETVVAIKEFYMEQPNVTTCVRKENGEVIVTEAPQWEGIVDRFKDKFMKEAEILFELKNKHIVHAKGFGSKPYFEVNNTVYYIMEYVSGGKLEQWIKSEGAYSDFRSAWLFLRPICEALTLVHQKKTFHLDLSPNNILIKSNGEEIIPVLIDFGSLKTSTTGKDNSLLSGIAPSTDGYSAPELSAPNQKVGVCTDIFSLGAIFYYVMSGMRPPKIDKDFTLENINTARIEKNLLEVMKKTMTVNPNDRFQSVQELIEACDKLAKYTPPTPNQEIEQTIQGNDDTGCVFGGTQIKTNQPADTDNTGHQGGDVQKEKEEVPKISANDPCPCGSGRKWKDCHGKNVVRQNVKPISTGGEGNNGQGNHHNGGETPVTPPKPTFWQQYGKITIIALVVAVVAAVVTSIDWRKGANPEPEPEPTPEVITPEEELHTLLYSLQLGEADPNKAGELFTEDAYFIILDDGVMIGSPEDDFHRMEHLLMNSSLIDIGQYKVTQIYRDNPGDNRITSITLEPISE